jgi:hypothetical protein
MVTRLDHLISVIDRDQVEELADRLMRAGFVHGDAGRHVGNGTANVNLAFAGGAFLELVYEESPGSSGLGWWSHAPVITGVVMNPSNYEADKTAWTGKEDAWDFYMEKDLEDGPRVEIRASGPYPRADFDPMLIYRSEPPFASRNAEARLLHLTLAGVDAGVWNERLVEYFGLEGDTDRLRLGDTEIRFEPGRQDPVELTATFAVPREKGLIELSRGRIELV